MDLPAAASPKGVCARAVATDARSAIRIAGIFEVTTSGDSTKKRPFHQYDHGGTAGNGDDPSIGSSSMRNIERWCHRGPSSACHCAPSLDAAPSFFPVAVITTDLAFAKFGLTRPRLPSTVTSSPGLSTLRLQPMRVNPFGLPISISHVVTMAV